MSSSIRYFSSFILLSLLVLSGVTASAGGSDAEDAAVEAFQNSMKEGGERERIKAVNTLAAVEGKSISRLLQKVVNSDRSEQVRAAAGKALGKRGNPRDLAFLVGCIRRLKKMPVALAGVLDGLGEFREPRVAEEIFDTGRYWLAKHKYPAMAAIRALGKIRCRDSITCLIKLYECTYPGPGHQRDPSAPPSLGVPGPTSDETSAVLADYRPFIENSLTKLTGESIGDLSSWKDWWDENERTFDPGQITDDVNRGLTLTDDEFGYAITRPNEKWRWIEDPEEGFTRTAKRIDAGREEGMLSLLTYSVKLRTPDTAQDMLDQLKSRLLHRMDSVKEQKWDEAVKVGEVDAIRQTVTGQVGDKTLTVQQSVLVHEGIMVVIRTTFDGWAPRSAIKSGEKFVESFRFL